MKNEEMVLTASDIKHSIDSARRYKVAFAALLLITSVLTATLSAYFITVLQLNEKYKEEITSLKFDNANKDYQIKLLNEEICDVNVINEDLINSNAKLKSSISSLKDVVCELQESNDKLIADNISLNKDLKVLSKRKELYDKYQYAILDEAGNRTDLTYDQIKTGETLMKEKGIDPDILFGVIMVESGGVEKCTNSESTARGYGQILKGTGKFIYEDIEGHSKGSYDHSMALNGYNNIRMASELWGYFNRSGKTLHQAIQWYRGKEDVSGYISGINSYLCKKGKSIYSCKW